MEQLKYPWSIYVKVIFNGLTFRPDQDQSLKEKDAIITITPTKSSIQFLHVALVAGLADHQLASIFSLMYTPT